MDSESEEEEDTSNPAVHFDTCLQNANGPSLEFSIAPGEGKQPISFLRDENAEVMSFPREFPKGKDKRISKGEIWLQQQQRHKVICKEMFQF